MELPKADKGLGSQTGFDLGKILGLFFLLVGILLIIALVDFNLPVDLSNFETILEYGAAVGSILGGITMLFKKKELTTKI